MGKNQHVVPAGDKWGIKGEGNSRLTSTFDRQSDAIAAARQISKNQHSELFIHGRNGQIRERDSHGKDPFPPRGQVSQHSLRLEKSPNTTGAGCGRVKMCHGEIRCGFFFLVESDITIFCHLQLAFFVFSTLFNKVKSSHFSFSVELASPLFYRLRSKSLI